MLSDLLESLKQAADPDKVKIYQRFFRTGKGEYGEGDIFLGIPVPQSRLIVKKYRHLSLSETEKLLHSKYHEARLIALSILCHKFNRGDDQTKQYIFHTYLKSTKYVNNWDLVDSSAPTIIGGNLLDKPKGILFKLAKSKSVWERRIAILATFQFIKFGQYGESLKIAQALLSDKHDLIHKAVGWMLREIGKRDRQTLEKFLSDYGSQMPRTALRYAIEHFPEKERRHYLESTRLK